MKKDEHVDWKDTQGLVLSGYLRLPFAAYVPWRFVSPISESKAWLRDLIGRLMLSADAAGIDQHEPAQSLGPTSLKSLKKHLGKGASGPTYARHVALTWTGLCTLGGPDLKKELSQFSAEFREGMAHPPRRCNILGDVGENSPQHWQWGGHDANGKIDGMLLLYATTENSLDKLIDDEMKKMCGVDCLQTVSGNNAEKLILKGCLIEGKGGPETFQEHFGFTDGISQPIIAGTPRAGRLTPKEAQISVVKPGEFLLGYKNERGDPSGVPSRGTKARAIDLARNGTYLVFRQLEQNVPAFRRELRNTARRVFGNTSLENQQWVAARMMGRKPNGDPLIPQSTHSPKRRNRLAAWVAARLIAHAQNSDPEKKKRYGRAWVDTLLHKCVGLPPGHKGDSPQKKPPNDFLYYFEDRFGLRCPIGAHIRRANPRDSLGPDPDTALRLSKMHRIIRRGRPYGKQLLEGPKTKNVGGQDEQRGMLFICLNADIAGQFELIQHSWINNGRFGGLYSETDPIMNYPGENRLLTIQRRPTSEDVHWTERRPTGERVGQTKRGQGFEQFVTVRGGAYFFLPGIRALRFLAG